MWSGSSARSPSLLPLSIWGPPPYPVCPDADVMMAASRDDGVTWSAPPVCPLRRRRTSSCPRSRPTAPVTSSTSPITALGVDPTFQRRSRISSPISVPGPATPDRVTDYHQITSLPNDLEAGPHPTQWTDHLPAPPFQEIGRFVGALGSIGLAARGTGADGGSRAYVHFTYNNIQGLYRGIPVPELNNHLGRLGLLSATKPTRQTGHGCRLAISLPGTGHAVRAAHVLRRACR